MFVLLTFTCYLTTVGLSWYIHNAAFIVSNKIAKKPFCGGTDGGEFLIFRQFIHSWVCYELVKVLHVFGLQPKIRSDIAKWLPEIHKIFNYFADKNNSECKGDATDVLDILLNKTNHMNYFGKCVFGSTKYIRQSNNPTLYLVVLTWLHQLQQGFFTYNDHRDDKDWNKYGCYYGINSKVSGKIPTLSNINMSRVRTKKSTLVTDLNFFKPDDV